MKEAEKAMAAEDRQAGVRAVSWTTTRSDAGAAAGAFPSLARGRSRVAQESGMEVAVFGQSAAERARQARTRASRRRPSRWRATRRSSTPRRGEPIQGQGADGAGQEAGGDAGAQARQGLEKQAEVGREHARRHRAAAGDAESSALQREVASALSASIATTKKKTRGLLEKAESAVDGSAELRDVAEEINEVMGGLAKADDYDEDDLLEELELHAQRERGDGRAAAAEEALPRRPAKARWSRRRSWWASTPRSSHPRPRRSARSSKSCWRPIRPPRSEQRFQGRTLESKSRDPAHGGRVPALRMGGEPLHGR